MLPLIIFLLLSWGVVYVVVASTIFAPIRVTLAARSRVLASFFYCAYCVGFWVGGLVLLASGEYEPEGWFRGGVLVMGATAVVRGFSDRFLNGAWERERDLVEYLQRQRGIESGRLGEYDTGVDDGGGGGGGGGDGRAD